MNDPRRLLDGAASDRERALLEAARDEQPSSASLAELTRMLELAPSMAPPPRVSWLRAAGWKSAVTALALGGALWTTVALPRKQAAIPPAPLPAEALPAPDAPSLAAELRELERARAALRNQHADQARTLLVAYLREHPRGLLLEEARALEVQTARALGEAARTRELARQFLQRYPSSVHAERVREAADAR